MNNKEVNDSDLNGKLAFRIPHVAHILSISVSKVKCLIRQGDLGCIKDDGVTLVTRKQLAGYIEMKEREQRLKG